MAKKNESDSKVTLKQVGIGVGLTATALSAVGAYFLYGSSKAAQNRKKVKGWMLKAKGEVLEALENAESITEAEYKALLNTVTNTCSTLKNVSKGELRDFKKEMTEHWNSIQKSAAVKKVLKKSTKQDSSKAKNTSRSGIKKSATKKPIKPRTSARAA